MRPLRTRLQEARGRLGLPWEVLERDYLLSWVLGGITRVDSLRETLVFKGGTALEKCYFGDYRHDPRPLPLAEAAADASHDRDNGGRAGPEAGAEAENPP